MLDGEDTAAGSRSLLLKACSVSLSKTFSIPLSKHVQCFVSQKTKNPESGVVGSQ